MNFMYNVRCFITIEILIAYFEVFSASEHLESIKAWN